ARHDTAAQHPVELPDPARQPLLRRRLDFGDGNRRGAAARHNGPPERQSAAQPARLADGAWLLLESHFFDKGVPGVAFGALAHPLRRLVAAVLTEIACL